MGYEQMVSNVRWILTNNDFMRVSVNKLENGQPIINLDLHGLTRNQAFRLMKNIINVNRGSFVINVIHGFNHGTVLKEMVMEESWNNRVVERISPVWNPGQTYLSIAV